jgi:hypothetical protein
MAPDSAGVYRIVAIVVLRRYDTLTLNQDFLYVSSTVPSASTVIAGPSPQKNYFVLRQTTLATSQSATKVKKGKTVKVTGLLKYATNAGYVPDNGERVLAQTRIGTGKWVTRATLTTTSTGAVAYYLAPLRTTQVRFVLANVYSGRYTAAAISATRTVTVG